MGVLCVLYSSFRRFAVFHSQSMPVIQQFESKGMLVRVSGTGTIPEVCTLFSNESEHLEHSPAEHECGSCCAGK